MTLLLSLRFMSLVFEEVGDRGADVRCGETLDQGTDRDLTGQCSSTGLMVALKVKLLHLTRPGFISQPVLDAMVLVFSPFADEEPQPGLGGSGHKLGGARQQWESQYSRTVMRSTFWQSFPT